MTSPNLPDYSVRLDNLTSEISNVGSKSQDLKKWIPYLFIVVLVAVGLWYLDLDCIYTIDISRQTKVINYSKFIAYTLLISIPLIFAAFVYLKDLKDPKLC